MSSKFSIAGNLVDVWKKDIYPAEVKVINGRISSIKKLDNISEHFSYILSGFIDSHVHIESSMLIPSEFARLAAIHMKLPMYVE